MAIRDAAAPAAVDALRGFMAAGRALAPAARWQQTAGPAVADPVGRRRNRRSGDLGPARRRIAAAGRGRQHRLRRYIDGALRAGTNVDLAGDARVVIVAEPMAHIYGTSSTAAGTQQVIQLTPDADAIKALGPDLTDLTAWAPAYKAGVQQAPSAAERIRTSSAVM
jgi:hypothetical protein